MLAETGAEMASAIAALLDDPAERRAIERQARETVVQRFDWDAIAAAQEQMYEELMAGAKRQASIA